MSMKCKVNTKIKHFNFFIVSYVNYKVVTNSIVHPLWISFKIDVLCLKIYNV